MQSKKLMNNLDFGYGKYITKSKKAKEKNLLNYKFPSIGMKRMVHTGNNRADIQQ